MIVNLKGNERYFLIKRFFKLMRMFIFDFYSLRLRKTLFDDSIKLRKFFQSGYPKLKLDSVGNSLCTSCFLCQDACPTKAIEIKKANMVNFPDSLTTGEAPMSFNLDITSCIQCGLCEQVCYVQALDLNGDYRANKVDLVHGIHEKKANL